MEDYPRRRRLQPQEPKRGGGIPIFPLIVLVIFAGLLLGGLLAKVFGGGSSTRTATPLPSFTPLPSAAPTATFAPRATPHPSLSPRESQAPSPASAASASPKASPSVAPSATTPPSAAPTATPSPRPSVIYITPAPKASAVASVAPSGAPAAAIPTQAPTAVLITGAVNADHAAAIVRAYLGAVGRGDQSTAAGYLANGLPNESFYSGGAKITNLETSRNGNGFTVTTSITAPTGNYYETFVVQPGPYGMQITDHSASPTQH